MGKKKKNLLQGGDTFPVFFFFNPSSPRTVVPVERSLRCRQTDASLDPAPEPTAETHPSTPAVTTTTTTFRAGQCSTVTA